MFERYTDRARRCVVLAGEHARMLNHAVIDVDHLLLGLAAEGEGVAAQALGKTGLDTDGIRGALAPLHPPGTVSPAGHMPFTNGARRALEDGLRESLRLGHPYVGTEHLLLGLLVYCDRHRGSVTAAALGTCGTSPDAVRDAVMVLLRGYGDIPVGEPPAESSEPADSRAFLLARLDGISRLAAEMRRQLEADGLLVFPSPGRLRPAGAGADWIARIAIAEPY